MSLTIFESNPALLDGVFEEYKSHSTCKRSRDCLDCFVVIFFFSFYFLNAFQSDNNSNRVHVFGHKYVLGQNP